METILLTYASCLHGMCFALVQMIRNNMRLVQCGSSSLTPTHQRYMVCELECMAVQYAKKKYDFFLRGLPHFEIWTDHKPLVGKFSNGLHNIDNPRLIRFCEKIMHYNFLVRWVQGKTHHFPDALSPAPVFSATELEEDKAELEDAIHCFRAPKDPIKNIIVDALEDKNYIKAKAQLLNLGKDKTPELSKPRGEYTSIIHTLSLIK